MFTVGQTVYHRDGKRSGKVLECDGSTIYIMQANGVETDCRADDLSETPPKAADHPANDAAVPSRKLTGSDITDEHRHVLAAIPVRVIQTVTGLFERRHSGHRYSELSVAQKLNFIADVSAVPYRTMKQMSGSPGELGLMMGKGLADSRATLSRSA